MSRSASVAFVMKVFRPWITQSSPSCRARELMAKASDPASGSVMAWIPTSRPEHSPGNHRARCSSDPCFHSGISDDHMWALIEKTRPPSGHP